VSRSLSFVIALALGLLALASGARAEDKPLTWEEAFSLAGAPNGVHIKASYVDGKGKPHTLEVWRDGDRRLRRRTDDALDLLADKAAGGDYAFRLVDHGSRRLVAVNRTNLYRIGVFADFPALAGLLARPKGAHALHREARSRSRFAGGECRWMRLEFEAQRAQPQSICWSDRFKVPLRIEGKAADGSVVTLFEVKQLEAKMPGDEAFKVDTKGFTVVKADQDIDPSSDM
jgi:hypothetical protein